MTTLDLMTIDPIRLTAHVIIIGLATIGNIEWFKSWVSNGKKGHELHGRCLLFISGIFLLISATVQMPFIPGWITLWYNLITLGNAVVKFGHTALVHVPEIMINKLMGDGNANNVQTV